MITLSKILPGFVYPLGLAIILIFAGLILMRRRTAKALIAGGLVTLWVASSPITAHVAVQALESQYPAQQIQDTPEADVAIVLGGAVAEPIAPQGDVELTDASDRVLHAARLYKAGRVKRIVVSAGNVPWSTATRAEAESIAELLREWGVPETAISPFGSSRNTVENALEMKAAQSQLGFNSALLITSAFHMPRAMGIFRKAGLLVEASPTDFRASGPPPVHVLAFLPDAGALAGTTMATKELLGLIVYKLLGRI